MAVSITKASISVYVRQAIVMVIPYKAFVVTMTAQLARVHQVQFVWILMTVSSVCVHHGNLHAPISSRLTVLALMVAYVFSYVIQIWHVVADMVTLARHVNTVRYNSKRFLSKNSKQHLTEKLFEIFLGDLCAPNPCANGGSCLSDGNSIRCSCKNGFQGDLCQVCDACSPNPVSYP